MRETGFAGLGDTFLSVIRREAGGLNWDVESVGRRKLSDFLYER